MKYMNMHEKYNMGGVTVKTFLFVLEAVLGLIVVISILMQKSKADALSGLIQGSKSETFFAKNKAKTKEAKVKRSSLRINQRQKKQC